MEIFWRRLTVRTIQPSTSNIATPYTEEKERDNIKVAKFSGKPSTWDVYSEKTISCFQRKGMRVLLGHLKDDVEVPKDSDDCTGPTTGTIPLPTGGPVDVEKKDYNAQNMRAFALLYDSINTDTEVGMTCFRRIQCHKTSDYEVWKLQDCLG